MLRSRACWDITRRMKTSKFWLATVVLPFACVWTLLIASPELASAQTSGGGLPDSGWPNYGNDAGGTRFSPATQINRDNVAQLKVAWTYRTGALDGIDDDLKRNAAFEATPILVEGRLYLSTPFDHVIALEPETGKKIWEYDPKLNTHGFSETTSRGVSAWKDSAAKAGQPCRLRIFIGTLDARLIAVDGETGKVCGDFGANGQIDLTKDVNLRDAGQYQVTSAPAIAGDVVITGSSIGDNRAVELERGIVRAFDVRSGKLRWSWDPIPWASKSSPRTGAGNAWSTLSVDAERDLVFIPTGSASPDYFGGLRRGDNKWANSVVALHASTGEFVWGFQVVHHDLWDYDVASQPTLFSWRDGTPAVAITTKMGRVFVLNRLIGAPLLPVEERPAPKSDIPGEDASPTQPASTISMVPEKISPEEAWGKTPEDKQACADKIRGARSEGIFTPPSLKGSIQFPGSVGGVNWGSAAYDPQRHLLVMDTNRLAYFVRLIPREKYDADIHAATSNDRAHGEWGRQAGTPYAMFRTPLIGPSETLTLCSPPPWGTVAAVDLFTGKKAWDVPLGSFVPGMNTGTVTLGGPIVTAGGVVFSAATMDNYIRAFDAESGKEIWKYELPAGGQATPMTYTLNGKQYLVIAAGGHGKLGTKQGDYVLAFTLP
jgi:quinoprotein glucose dehydrogenase